MSGDDIVNNLVIDDLRTRYSETHPDVLHIVENIVSENERLCNQLEQYRQRLGQSQRSVSLLQEQCDEARIAQSKVSNLVC
jgi:hypothetical protein